MRKFFNDLNIEEEVNIKIDESIQVMKNEGLQIIDNIDLNWPHNPADIFNIIWQTGAANLSKKISTEEFSKIDKNFLGFIEKGNSYSVFDLMGAEAKRAENAVYLSHVFEKVDFLNKLLVEFQTHVIPDCDHASFHHNGRKEGHVGGQTDDQGECGQGSEENLGLHVRKNKKDKSRTESDGGENHRTDHMG